MCVWIDRLKVMLHPNSVFFFFVEYQTLSPGGLKGVVKGYVDLSLAEHVSRSQLVILPVVIDSNVGAFSWLEKMYYYRNFLSHSRKTINFKTTI